MNRVPAFSSFRTRRPFSRPRRSLLTVLLGSAALAAGCSPEYNWREIRGGNDHYRVMLPGKPSQMTRPIDLDGMKVSMTMQGAQVGDVAFTVAAAELPDASEAVRERAIGAMRTAMVRNIGGRETDARAMNVPVVDISDRLTGTAPGWRIDAVGQSGGRPVELHAVFTARNGRAWQAVVVGPTPDPVQAQQFLDGFRLTD